MVHVFKRDRQTLKKLDEIALMNGWKNVYVEGENRMFSRDGETIRFMKFDGGFKVILKKGGKTWDIDVSKYKNTAIMYVGERLMWNW